jgi:hypothetical protein
MHARTSATFANKLGQVLLRKLSLAAYDLPACSAFNQL